MNGSCLTTTIAILGDTDTGKSTLAKRWSSISNFERLYRGFVDSLDENDQLPPSGSNPGSGAVSRTNTGVSFSPPSARGGASDEGQTLSKAQTQIMRQESLRWACAEAAAILEKNAPPAAGAHKKSDGVEYFTMDVAVEGCPEAAAHRVFILDTPGDKRMSAIPTGLVEKQSMKGGVQAVVIICVPPKLPGVDIPKSHFVTNPWASIGDASTISPPTAHPSSPTHTRRRTSVVSVLDVAEIAFPCDPSNTSLSVSGRLLQSTSAIPSETPRPTVPTSFQEFKTASTLLATPHTFHIPSPTKGQSRAGRFGSPSRRPQSLRRMSDQSNPSGSSSSQQPPRGLSPMFTPPSLFAASSSAPQSATYKPLGVIPRRGSFVSIATSNNQVAEGMDRETDFIVDVSQMPDYLKDLAAKLEMCERNQTPVLLFHVGVPGEQEGYKIITEQKRRQSSVDYRRGDDDESKTINLTKAGFGQLVKRYTSTIFRCLVLMDNDDQFYDEIGFLAVTKALADVVQHSHDFRQYQATRLEYEKRQKKELEEAELRKCKPKVIEKSAPVALEYEVVTDFAAVQEQFEEAKRREEARLRGEESDQRIYDLHVRLCGAPEGGKTALLSALVDNFSRVNYDPTEGPEVASCLLKLKRYDPVGKALKSRNIQDTDSPNNSGLASVGNGVKVPPIAIRGTINNSRRTSSQSPDPLSNSVSVSVLLPGSSWGKIPTHNTTASSDTAKKKVSGEEFEGRLQRWKRNVIGLEVGGPVESLNSTSQDLSQSQTMRASKVVYGNSTLDNDLKADRQNFERLKTVSASTRSLLEAEALDQRMATAAARSKVDKQRNPREAGFDSHAAHYKPPRILSQLREARKANLVSTEEDNVLGDALAALNGTSLRAALQQQQTALGGFPGSPTRARLDSAFPNQSDANKQASPTSKRSARADDPVRALASQGDLKMATTFQKMREAAAITSIGDFGTKGRKKQKLCEPGHPSYAEIDGLTRKKAVELFAAERNMNAIARHNSVLHLTFHDGLSRELLHASSSARRPTRGPQNEQIRKRGSIVVTAPMETSYNQFSDTDSTPSPSRSMEHQSMNLAAFNASWGRSPATEVPRPKQKECQVRILVVDGSKSSGLEDAATSLEYELPAPHTLVLMTKYGEEGSTAPLHKVTPGVTARRRKSSFLLDPASCVDRTSSVAGSLDFPFDRDGATEAPTRRPTIQQSGVMTDDEEMESSLAPSPTLPTHNNFRRPSWARNAFEHATPANTSGSFAFTPTDPSFQKGGRYQQGVTLSDFEEFAGRLGAYCAVVDARKDQWPLISRFLTAVLADEERTRSNVPTHSAFSPPPLRRSMALKESVFEGTVVAEADKVYGEDAEESLAHLEAHQREARDQIELRKTLVAAQQALMAPSTNPFLSRGQSSAFSKLRRNSSIGGLRSSMSNILPHLHRRQNTATEAAAPPTVNPLSALTSHADDARREDEELIIKLKNPRLKALLAGANRAEAAGRPIPLDDRGLRELFDEFDVNHNGTIDETELTKLLFRFGVSQLFNPVEVVQSVVEATGITRSMAPVDVERLMKTVAAVTASLEVAVKKDSDTASQATNHMPVGSAELLELPGPTRPLRADKGEKEPPSQEEELARNVLGNRAIDEIAETKHDATLAMAADIAAYGGARHGSGDGPKVPTAAGKASLLALTFDQFALAMAMLARL